MNAHNKEPWIIEPSEDKAIWSKGGKIFIGECASKKNAARIVACVNACAGIEDPQAEIERLKADKARLLEAVRTMHEATSTEPSWQFTHRALASILNEINT